MDHVEIIAIKIQTQRDLLKIVDEIHRGNVIIASFSAFKNIKIRRDLVRRILETSQKMRFNILGVGSEYIIIAPPKIRIKIERDGD
ncbi:MAG: hypothetical protein Q6363_000175 [Candidatus Njordarchaeota archaeon]